jgi:hypothetical protein
MPSTKRNTIDSLALIAGVVVLMDSLWGGIAALGLDLSRTNQLILGISLILGFPTYLLDLWLESRIAISMFGLFVFRWLATCFAGPTPVLCNPWRGNILLIVAIVLLQFSKLRRERKPRHNAFPA